MTVADWLLALACGIVFPVWGWWSRADFRRRVFAGEPGARLAAYAENVIAQWLLATVAVALWVHQARDWSALGLAWGDGWPMAGALAVATAVSVAFFGQNIVIAQRPALQAQARDAIQPLSDVLPADRNDFTGFAALALTAGICEELLYRGYLPWMLQPWLGIWAAHAVALGLFGLAHIYAGTRGVLGSMAAGAAAAALYLWSGSLVPAMIAHASVDLATGFMAYSLNREAALDLAHGARV